MLRCRILPILALLGALAPAASAGAAPPWSGAVDVSTDPALPARNPGIGFDGDGSGLFTWALDRNPLNRVFLTARRSVAPNGTLEREQFATDSIVGRPVFFAARRVALLRRRARSGGEARLFVQFAATHDAAGPSHEIGRTVGSSGAAISGSRLGFVAVVFSERRPGSDVLWLALRRPKGSFGRPLAIRSGPSFTHVTVAVGDGGKLVVAYGRAGRTEVRVRRPGSAIDPPQDIGSAAELQSLQAAVAQNGQAVAALQRARSLAGVSAPRQEIVSVRAAVLGAGQRRFGRLQSLATPRGAVGGDAPVRVAIGAFGRATVAWTAASQGVVTARTDLGGRFRAPRQLASDGLLGDLALDEDGAAVVVWAGPAGDVLATLVSKTGVEGPAELVSAGERAAVPVAAFNPRESRPTVAWLSRLHSDDSGVRVRASTRVDETASMKEGRERAARAFDAARFRPLRSTRCTCTGIGGITAAVERQRRSRRHFRFLH